MRVRTVIMPSADTASLQVATSVHRTQRPERLLADIGALKVAHAVNSAIRCSSVASDTLPGAPPAAANANPNC